MSLNWYVARLVLLFHLLFRIFGKLLLVNLLWKHRSWGAELLLGNSARIPLVNHLACRLFFYTGLIT